MEVVHRLSEAASRPLFAILIEDVDLDGPLLHGKALIDGRLVSIPLCQLPISHVLPRGEHKGWKSTYMLCCSVTTLILRYRRGIALAAARPPSSSLPNPTHLDNHLVDTVLVLPRGRSGGGAHARSADNDLGFAFSCSASRVPQTSVFQYSSPGTAK